jgi:hypothetical protein
MDKKNARHLIALRFCFNLRDFICGSGQKLAPGGQNPKASVQNGGLCSQNAYYSIIFSRCTCTLNEY